MRIIMNQEEIVLAIKDSVSKILEGRAFKVDLTPAVGDEPMEAEIIILPTELPFEPDTVGAAIVGHVGPEVKVEPAQTIKPKPKRTRRTPAQMAAARAEEEKAKEPTPVVEEVEPEKAEEPVKTKVPAGTTNVDSLFNT